jgi:hypothetical protein
VVSENRPMMAKPMWETDEYATRRFRFFCMAATMPA